MKQKLEFVNLKLKVQGGILSVSDDYGISDVNLENDINSLGGLKEYTSFV